MGLRERHLVIPSPTACCFHSQPEGMREGDSDRNPRVGPLKAAERRWDPSGGSRHLPAVPAQRAQILPPLPTSARDPWWQNSTRAGALGAPQQSCTGMEGRGEGPVPWHTAWRRAQEGRGQTRTLAYFTNIRHLSHSFPGKPFLASLCLEVLLLQ